MSSTATDNPLLDLSGPPRFAAIRPEHVEPAVRARIAEVEALIERLVAAPGRPTWASLVEPLDAAQEALGRAWGPVEHLNSTMNTDALREVYRATKPLLAEHEARVGQDERLFRAFEAVRARADEDGLSAAQRKVLDEVLRDFRLAGVALPAEQKPRFREIKVELSRLEARFADNVLDVTRAYRLVVEDPADLAGLPERVVAAARQQALDDDPAAPERRWSFTLHAPSVQPFLQYATSRPLRERLYRAFTTRATEGEQDNGPIMTRILELRRELAGLLGYANYAEVSLATKMAPSPEQALEFLRDLARKSLPFGRRDKAELDEFARRRDGLERLEAWDFAFYREALRQERYSFSDEEVRQYFPLERALSGLFEVLRRLYGVRLADVSGRFETWHPDARTLEVTDGQGEPVGHMFLDLFARDGKKPGAWMGDCLERRRRGGDLQRPIAYLVCNFAPPLGGTPSLLRHDEVRTLFHECGHALHHVLTKVDLRQVSGINRVPWDGVELPSQFHENWVWHPESLALLAGHVDTGAPLPGPLLERMLAAKNFQSGADMLRQLEFALFDLTLHTEFDPAGSRTVHDVIEAVRDEVAVLRPPAWNRFENAFSHIFAGGYAAGYYSYKWAEVLAADAFARFEEEGIFSAEAGRDFKEHILGQGGSEDLMTLFVRFRGREPSPEALLRQSGLVAAT
ncbi:MAG: M3 family metallopeptidase [Planctomycetes bacterium]|nr:M3 family metallopeptidase [Planctomycetota bacterium]